MNKIYIFSAIAALALAASCSERVDIPEPMGVNVISLDLVYGEPATKATTPGEGLENQVTSLQYFFYNDTTAVPVYNSGVISGDDLTITNLKYSVTLTAGEGGVPDLTTLFKNGECIVYAVFNYPTEIEAAPLATVKALAVTNTFAHQDGVVGDASFSDWVVTTDAEAGDHPKYFVMVGRLALTRAKGEAYAAKGTVEMNRVAAKIAVTLKIKKQITAADNRVWIPMLGGRQIRVYPNNVASNAVLGGAEAKAPNYPNDLGEFTYKEVVYQSYYPEDYLAGGSLAGQTDPGKVVISGNDYVIESQHEFYTFPMSWTNGRDDEPFLKVIVPWRSQDGTTSQREIYYKVMLPMTSIQANKFYKFTVNVSVLGTEGEPEVTLGPLSAQVVSWNGGGDVNGTISAAKYLSVERGVVTATSNYDTADGRFEFYTSTSGTDFFASDDVTATIKEIKQKNLSTGNWEFLYQNFSPNSSVISNRRVYNASGQLIQLTQDIITNDWVQILGGNYLQVGHQLISDLTSQYMDVTPYYYTIVLSLPASIDPRTNQYPYGKYAKTVTFVQWPEVYVVADQNGDYVSASSSVAQNNTHYGYVYVNNNHSDSSSSGTNYERVTGLTTSSATNNNPNMYVLTVSVSNTYIIGDPRTTSSNLLGWTNNWVQSYWTENASVTNHRLAYYRPGANSGVDNMIAPKIRIASSYGKSRSITKDAARKRCASYQEDGIPAGRWRLPTFAEVEFIATLSSLGRIPILFSDEETADGDYYWVSNGSDSAGAALVDNVGVGKGVTYKSSGVSSAFVRCVYDEWYWGDAIQSRPLSNKSRFTWGDPSTN